MFQDEVNKVETPALEQLQRLGWRFVPGADLAPDGPSGERAYYRDVVLSASLEAALRRLNPWLSDENLRKVMREFTHPNHAGLMEYNQSLYELLVNYLSVDQDLGKGRKGQTVRVIDFENPENNDFLCTSQYKVTGPVQNIIPDIVCFVNGLPLAVLECKSPYITDPMAEGVDQLRRYANRRYPESEEGAPRLFWYNQFMVALSRDHARVGTISGTASHYAEWKDAYPETDADIQSGRESAQPWQRKDAGDVPSPAYLVKARQISGVVGETVSVTPQERLLAGMFNRHSFLDLIRNFVIYEPVEGRLIKKVARYQQYRAVNRVIERLRQGSTRKEKSGVVWHTQGSGKSLTMVMLAMKMRRDPALQQYKMVFVTDRAQLDSQLSRTFRDAQDETVQNADSIGRLKQLLASDASDIVTATVQKFQEAESEADFTHLNPSDKVVVLADEAHRTQFGNLAMTINAALPNAPKIGFTGTPLMTSQKMDAAFGGYIDRYKIDEAVEDGATVRIIYEGREVRTDVVGRSLDALFDEYFGDRTDEEKAEIRKKYGVERAVREAPARIRWVCLDLLKHYRERIQPDGFKAMIVVGSRHAAAVFKQTLDELEAPPSEVIISGDHNDPPHLAQYTNKAHQKQVIENFKKPLDEDPISFLIVKDMLLTGFDAPIMQVMYLDRMLKDHTLMQAIARVNRTYKGKSAGYIVDYYGLSNHLTEALDQFSSDDVEGAYHTLKDEIPKLEAAHTRVAQLFSAVSGDAVDDYVHALKDEDQRQQFELQYKRFAKQLNVVLPDPAAKPYIASLKFWGKVQNAARNLYHDQGLDIRDAGAKVRELVEEHIISTGVDPRIPPVDLMDAAFQESVDELKSDESRASKIESAIRDHITVNLDEDPEYYKSLSQRLEAIIQQSHGKWEQQIDLLDQLIGTIDSERGEQAESLGLSKTEYAFYNILMAEVTGQAGEAMVDETAHDEIRQATRELVAMFEEATQIIDFFSKPEELKRMKKLIKHTVLECSFADKAIVKAVQDRFMELAQTKFGQ